MNTLHSIARLSTLALASALALSAACALGNDAIPPVDTSCEETLTPEPTQAASDDLPGLAREAVSSDEGVRTRAQELLRAAGRRGVNAFWDVHGDFLTESIERAGDRGEEDSLALTREALDRVCAQKDCDVTRLHWHTDLDAARAEAAKTGKPILSLRLLGRLDEHLSCANSRFFRTVLYPDPQVNAALRDSYVLHWAPERPVPRITIDFGDGAVIERTITGNSVHYVLDADGRPVDAIPGLVTAPQFRAELDRGAALVAQLKGLTDGERRTALIRHHRAALAQDDQRLRRDMTATGRTPTEVAAFLGSLSRRPTAATPTPPPTARREMPLVQQRAPMPQKAKATPTPTVQPAPTVPAPVAMPIAVGKSKVEAPMLAPMLDLGPAPTPPPAEETWDQVGAQRLPEATLSPAALALMKRQEPAKRRDGATFEQMRENFAAAVSKDSVRNTHDLHRTIHEWFIAHQVGDELSQLTLLNARVYTDLFKTPRADPWLGMVPAATYTGLENAGWVR